MAKYGRKDHLGPVRQQFFLGTNEVNAARAEIDEYEKDENKEHLESAYNLLEKADQLRGNSKMLVPRITSLMHEIEQCGYKPDKKKSGP